MTDAERGELWLWAGELAKVGGLQAKLVLELLAERDDLVAGLASAEARVAFLVSNDGEVCRMTRVKKHGTHLECEEARCGCLALTGPECVAEMRDRLAVRLAKARKGRVTGG